MATKKKPAANAAAGNGKMKLRALTSLSGKYLLPYDIGNEFEIDEKQASEIVDAGDGEYVN